MKELKELQIALHCMKFQAEIEVCEECSEYETCTHLTRKEVARTCISAIEKQIPQKPVIKPDKYTDVVQQYYCPNFGRYFGQRGIHNVILFNKERFCQGEGCGQAIDWNTED